MAVQAGGTLLLLHMDSWKTGTSSLLDSSPANRSVVTERGSPRLSTTQSKFGGLSLYFDGSSSVYAPGSSDWDFRWGDFTIEFFAWFDTLAGTPHAINAGTNEYNRFTLYWSGGICRFYTNLHGAAGDRLVASEASSVGVWEHWALVRSGATTTLYKNGVSVASATNVPMPDLSSTGTTLGLGTMHSGYATGDYLKGYLDDLRIVHRRAAYAGAFTPPTAPLGVLPGIDLAVGLMPQRRLLGRHTPGFNPQPGMRGRAFDLRDRVPLGLPVTPIERQNTPSELRPWQFKGRGRIAGSVKEKHLPDDLPLRRRVRLYREPDGRLVRTVWSDAATGAYEFYGVPLNARYTVVSHDYTGQYRAVIADNLSPEAIP